MNHDEAQLPGEDGQAPQAQAQTQALTIEQLTLRLHAALGRTLLDQIEAGEASSGVLAAAIKWLKDQNMVLNMGSENLPTEQSGPSLVKDLPFHDKVFKQA